MIEPGKDIRFSSSVKHLHNMHLSRRLHRSTSDGLLMVAQRKGALNIQWWYLLGVPLLACYCQNQVGVIGLTEKIQKEKARRVDTADTVCVQEYHVHSKC